MKLTFNNFLKAYLLFGITVIGLQGGGHAYYIAYKLLLLMFELGIITFPLYLIGFYISVKIALKLNPNATDAVDIAAQMEEGFAYLKSPSQILKNILAFIKALPTNTVAFLKS